MLPFEGLITELPNVSVDRFDKTDNADNLSTCFFLSHCHTDHMSGLNANFAKFLKKNGYVLYCSPISRLILMNMGFSFDDDQVQAFQGTQDISVPGSAPYKLTVTMIPAGHCPGSVMFLFQGVKTILYTGDFRIARGDVQKFEQLKNYSNGGIDKLYFDQTFFHEDYQYFPERSESAKCAIQEIRRRREKNPEVHIMLVTPAKYGYENLFVELSKEFNCKIHVKNDIYEVFSNVHDIARSITADETTTWIHHICPRITDSYSFRYETIRFSAGWYKSGPIRPEIVRYNKGHFDAVICYATHCSYSEISDFIDYLKPKSRAPICNVYSLCK